ncbi:DEAD/DEAH box helicase [Pedobacter arcticus]|uniref:DEAD/DEAH box helicase n=1 Tax=Pedobacter arcticus TaxID=752140 RepID=UPI0002DA8C3C|nr:SNF2-related protein [Pedobacter arcticus]
MPKESHPQTHRFVFEDFSFEDFSEQQVLKYLKSEIIASNLKVHPLNIQINQASFEIGDGKKASPIVTLVKGEKQLLLSCDCGFNHSDQFLCDYQAKAILTICNKPEYRVFFYKKQRNQIFKAEASAYGLENEEDLSIYFELIFEDNSYSVKAKNPQIVPLNSFALKALKTKLAEVVSPFSPQIQNFDKTKIIVLKQHKYYRHLCIDFYEANLTKDGSVKNPLVPLNPLDFIWNTDRPEEIKFFSALQKFANPVEQQITATELKALRAIVENPNNYCVFQHQNGKADQISASILTMINLRKANFEIKMEVLQNGDFYHINASVSIGGKQYELSDIHLRYDSFITRGNDFYLVEHPQKLAVISWLKQHPAGMQIHQSKYLNFKRTFLENIEDQVDIHYKYLKIASQAQLKSNGFLAPTEKIIYLSDFGEHVMVIPVMRYGEAEVQVRSRKQVYGLGKGNKEFLVTRDDEKEVDFIALLTKQHAYFAEQLENGLHYFYLHKKHFLNEEWFLNTFEEWQNRDITILGFNELENNALNLNKAKITIKIISGLNWFNVNIKAGFGVKKASLKHLHKAIRNKHKYVKLDDGTLGILPEEWISKFADYFNVGEVIDEETLQIPKINFTTVDELFDAEMLDEKASEELKYYKKQFVDFDRIGKVEVPKGLQTELRDYQKQGLNWLNFLDEFNFGGILADDMGLGKTVQIIAFILLQQQKSKQNTNLLVLPTSLIFNWQAEFENFAPNLKVLTLYGDQRQKSIDNFGDYQVVITTYGTLLSDVNFLKNYLFNYIFLDESQAIKNPESQRYKAARLLQSRNKVAITGTPIENNTYDLYGQLSFACPGLLGSKRYFKDIYAMPIDMFKDGKKASALHQKVKPFILRRTKSEVDLQLPEKTEMVIYCEMETEQRRIYEAYEKEFREYISAITNEELRRDSMNVLKGLTRLRQICNSPKLLKGDRLPGDQSVKIDMLISQIKEHSPNHKILVFSQFVGMLDLVKAQLMQENIAFSYLTGQTQNRKSVVEGFQTDESIKVFLVSLKAGGVGLNLTEADYVYLIDPWWNPAVENQAIDRVHRIGQTKKVVAIRLICNNTVEEKMLELQQRKRELFQNVIPSDNEFVSAFSKEELLKIIG